MKVSPISPNREDVSDLLKQAAEYAENLYPNESNHLEDATTLSEPNVYFVGAFFQKTLVGIGAVKALSNDQKYGEIKSIFVLPEYRGKNVSKHIMNELEGHLRASGISLSRLETGIYQLEAVGLYEQLGYTACSPFGTYKCDPLSLFMEKRLYA